MFAEEKTLSKKMGINLKGWRHRGIFARYKVFYKVSERTILYDEDALQSWIKEKDGKYLYTEQGDLDKLLSRWKADTKINQTS